MVVAVVVVGLAVRMRMSCRAEVMDGRPVVGEGPTMEEGHSAYMLTEHDYQVVYVSDDWVGRADIDSDRVGHAHVADNWFEHAFVADNWAGLADAAGDWAGLAPVAAPVAGDGVVHTVVAGYRDAHAPVTGVGVGCVHASGGLQPDRRSQGMAAGQ